MKIIRITVNGQPVSLGVKENETLQDVLRERLGLTGTKKGCSRGVCGACTVLIDRQPRNSCLTLAALCDGSEITTVEGLAVKGTLHSLQKAFIHSGAVQCGYCTPGMLISAYALIQRDPDPSDEAIKEALGGNLCRCTGYKRIIEAVRSWRDYVGEPEATAHPDDLERFSVVGKSHPRPDAWDKVTGKAVYTGDLALPGMLYGKLLHSPIAHGKILDIDTAEAEKLPGVVAVITGKDTPDIRYGISPARYDEPLLAKDKVLYVGDPVAAVAATDEETALQALKLIKVEYDPLEPMLDPVTAMQPGSPQLLERYQNNINTLVDHHFGDVQKGFAEADYVMEETFVGNFTTQAPMEPHAAIADWKPDLLTIYSASQIPHYLHYSAAHVFGIPLGKIKVVRPSVGGGFGGKAQPCVLDLTAAALSKETGRPVKMVFTREETFLWHRGRHKQHITMKLGMTKDGRMTALESNIVLDGGAYSSFGVITAYYAGSMILTLYKIPNYRYYGRRVVTNKPACGAMRGHGTPQPRFALECLINMMCQKYDLDPVEVRHINGMDPNTHTVNDLDIGSCEFKQCLDKVAQSSGFREKLGKLPRGRGIGLSCGGFVSGSAYAIYRGSVQQHGEKDREPLVKRPIFPHANAYIKISEDGTQAVVFIGAAEIGQGSDTVLCQIAAEALGLPLHRVRIRSDDTDTSPIDLGAYSSRVTLMAGNAVKMAADQVLQRLFPLAAEVMGCSSGELQAHNGMIVSREDDTKQMAWEEAARSYFDQHSSLIGRGWYNPPEGLGGDYKGAVVGTSPAYSFGASVCEVSVDMDTGSVRVDRFWDFHDCGTPINPMAAHGQVEGAVVMTSGEALMEEMVFDDQGKLLNPNLHEYLLMTIRDAPEIFSGFADSYEPAGPFGAKEIGEGATVPVLGAVASAIADAIGVWITDLPITPAKILQAINSQKPKKR
ncbi:MAG: molybdopterin-dependent oxidoreductase [Anaerolineales bacterium]|jgi:4-hydroxybenzoyl-CoA reductase subunit alpha